MAGLEEDIDAFVSLLAGRMGVEGQGDNKEGASK